MDGFGFLILELVIKVFKEHPRFMWSLTAILLGLIGIAWLASPSGKDAPGYAQNPPISLPTSKDPQSEPRTSANPLITKQTPKDPRAELSAAALGRGVAHFNK